MAKCERLSCESPAVATIRKWAFVAHVCARHARQAISDDWNLVAIDEEARKERDGNVQPMREEPKAD